MYLDTYCHAYSTALICSDIHSGRYCYVNDSLRIGVRAEPNTSVAPQNVVITGMQLEVLEREGSYIKIRSDDGVEGWIK